MKSPALRLVSNKHAVSRLAKWPKLAAPIYADETQNKMVAVSALRCFPMLDLEPVHACDLTAEQAADLARWARTPA